MMKTKTLTAALVAAGVLGVGTAGAIELPHWLGGKSQPSTTPTDRMALADTNKPVPPLTGGQVPNYRGIVKQYGPAVVGITVSGMHKVTADENGGLPPELQDDPFFRFFRGMPGPQGRSPQQPFRGQGSGFIVSADGLILTNAHVVREAKEVTVKLGDRREYTAKVLGSDPATDVAVLKIEAKNLPTVRLGDPRNLEVGDAVLAIGAPYGLEQTATQGIVSAKGRSLPGDGAVPFIQTDAAVNPGNSGGPLFDANGEVVGINAQIYSQSGGFQGLSFAIPINVAMKVKDQIVATGKVQHARLGVTIQDVNQSLADSFGLERPDGALVSSVAAGSAAANAGLKPGDVVLAVDGQPVTRSGELSSAIGLMAPGSKVTLKVWRDKSAREVVARLGESQPDKATLAKAEGDVQPGQLGLAMRPLSSEEKRAAKVEGGLAIEDVGGPAERAGIQAGDVLLAINGKAVDSVDQVKGVLQSKPRSVALLVQRDGEKIFVPVKLG